MSSEDLKLLSIKPPNLLGEEALGFVERPLSWPIDPDNYKLECTCLQCFDQFEIKITPFVSQPNQYGFGYLQDRFQLLSEGDMPRVRFRIELKEHLELHPRSYRIGSCPAIGRHLQCPSCDTSYLMIFSVGEQQPSRDSIFVAGVWHVAASCSL